MGTTDNREAAFMGKITAAATHEIRNVLAIIQESGGLIEDMIRFYEESGKLKPDHLLRSVERIGLQVNRGAELMTALNRVAHGLGSFGGYQAIRYDAKQDVYYGASESRKDGQAAGY